MKLSGIVNVNKPPGWTSREVVDRVQRLVRPARAGHAGTLDPLATGVLVVCVGQATRLTQYVQRMAKEYRATFLLGRRSPTDDTEGEVTLVDEAPESTRAAIEAALPRFVGRIEQRPPAHSAVKVAGRRAYRLARQGRPVELAARTVTVHHLAVVRYEYPKLELDILCGSGTYIRALGRDLAASLGTAAVMSALERTAVGHFRVEDAVSLDELNDDSLSEHLQRPLVAVADLPLVELSEEQLEEIRHGRPIESSSCATGSASANQTREQPSRDTGKASGTLAAEWAAVDSNGRLGAVLFEKYPGQLWPTRNFE